MRRAVFLFCLLGLVVSTSSFAEPPVVSTAGDQAYIAAANQFSIQLFRQMCAHEEGKNLAISPLAAHNILTMIYSGTGGETAAELKSVLKVEESPADIHTSLACYLHEMEEWQNHDTINELDIHSALWYDQSFPIEPSYISTFSNDFRGELTACQYGSSQGARSASIAINAWFAKYSRGAIRSAIEPDEINSGTVAILTNALWFHGKWTDPFTVQSTRPSRFFLDPGHAVLVSMMDQSVRGKFAFRILETSDYQVLDAPYGNQNYSMQILLPRDASHLQEIIANLDTAEISRWTEALFAPPGGIDIYLPKFKLQTKRSLKSLIENLGATSVFSNRANIARMFSVSGASIKDILQCTAIEVDESGTIAASATHGMTRIGGPTLPPKPALFLANHPFLFLIRHNATGAILFMGCVMDPTAE